MSKETKTAPDYAGHSGAHTPGPWEHYIPTFAIKTHRICNDGGTEIATLNGRHGVDEIEANARLLAAAPDMLAALKEIIRFVDSVGSEHINRVPFAAGRAAIAKAEAANMAHSYTHDPRRSFMAHGETSRRNMHRRPEPPVSFWQATASAVALAAFVVGGLCVMAGVL